MIIAIVYSVLYFVSLFLCVVRRTIRINHEYTYRFRHFLLCSICFPLIYLCVCVGALNQQQNIKHLLHLALDCCHLFFIDSQLLDLLHFGDFEQFSVRLNELLICIVDELTFGKEKNI